jgi:hypothetical protein
MSHTGFQPGTHSVSTFGKLSRYKTGSAVRLGSENVSGQNRAFRCLEAND